MWKSFTTDKEYTQLWGIFLLLNLNQEIVMFGFNVCKKRLQGQNFLLEHKPSSRRKRRHLEPQPSSSRMRGSRQNFLLEHKPSSRRRPGSRNTFISNLHVIPAQARGTQGERTLFVPSYMFKYIL